MLMEMVKIKKKQKSTPNTQNVNTGKGQYEKK